MKEVCFDARMIFSGGIGTYIKNLILQLKNRSFKVRLLLDPSNLDRCSWLEGFDIIPCRSPIYSIREQIELPFCIPKSDLFWSPHFNIPLFPIRAKKRLVTINDAFHLAFFSTLTPLQKTYAKLFFKAAGSLSEKIITVSKFSEAELMKLGKIDREKLCVIHLGVDSRLFHPHKDPIILEKVKQLYNLPSKYILFVGNVKPHKNLRGLLAAFSLLIKEKKIDSHLVVVGQRTGFVRGEEFDCFFQQEELAQKVMFLNYVEEDHLAPLYHLAQMMVLPSFYEGFGLPVLEAMSCGCPVVASKAGSLPEICGDAAEYLDPYDTQDIGDKISNVLNHRDLLVQKGFERVRLFQWEKTAERHVQLIEQIMV